jgi:hypothetical protein
VRNFKVKQLGWGEKMADEKQEITKGQPPLTNDRILTYSGYLLIIVAVFCFGAIAYLKIYASLNPVPQEKYTTALDFFQHESTAISLLIIGYIAASMGRRLLTTIQLTNARTIPLEDLPLIEAAVVAGNPDPIDQYMRLRSLSGISGNFSKLGVTGLPLTTVFLTLVFALIALFPLENTKAVDQFLDMAKLTLGAFIGSFVQGRVEQRKQQDAAASGKPASKGEIIA